MKLLIDENFPKRLKADFPTHDIYTVTDMGWNSKKNGELMKLMMEAKFHALFTFDRNLQYQQNFGKYPLAVFVLNAEDNTYAALQPLIPIIHVHLEIGLKPGPIEIKN